MVVAAAVDVVVADVMGAVVVVVDDGCVVRC